MTEILVKHISSTLAISKSQVSNTVKLLEEGATIPFISRYRKEATGSLDETEVTAIEKEWKRLLELVKRRETILKSINDQELLTPELEAKINNCWNMAELEDIYLPYKPKRKTRASAAREKGLEPLAEIIMAQKEDKIDKIAEKYLNDEVPDIEAALAGARDIIAEWINENADARNKIRQLFERDAIISSKVIEKKKDEGTKYQDYFDFNEPLERCAGHRLLAIRRAEQEGILRVSISTDNESAIESLEKIFIKNKNESSVQVGLSIKDAHKRLLGPSIETEFKNSSKAKADEEAIRVFSENLRQLLLSPPLGPKVTMAIDPGFRTGCKLVCLDQQGNLLHHATIFPHPPQPKVDEATEKVTALLKKYKVEAIAIGNGTAGRETERFIKSLIGETSTTEIFMVNEAGASIYSASETAREEFPDLDLTFRGAISIGRRLMDPLAELVKIDAKSIGVGQYQHDVNQDSLKDGLDKVVTSAVNQVGVNLNTASREKIIISPEVGYWRNEIGSYEFKSELEIEWKPSSQISFTFGPEYASSFASHQWVGNFADQYAINTYNTRYVFADLNQKTLSANIRLNWIFTPTLSLQLYVQPLLAVGDYEKYKEITNPPTLEETQYGSEGTQISYDTETGTYTVDPDAEGPAEVFSFHNPDFNFKSLRGNLVLRWEALPGSVFYFAWTNSRMNFENPGEFNFRNDFSNLINSESDDVFLVKFSYWIDI